MPKQRVTYEALDEEAEALVGAAGIALRTTSYVFSAPCRTAAAALERSLEQARGPQRTVAAILGATASPSVPVNDLSVACGATAGDVSKYQRSVALRSLCAGGAARCWSLW